MADTRLIQVTTRRPESKTVLLNPAHIMLVEPWSAPTKPVAKWTSIKLADGTTIEIQETLEQLTALIRGLGAGGIRTRMNDG